MEATAVSATAGFRKETTPELFSTFRGLAKDLIARWERDLHDDGQKDEQGRTTLGLKLDPFFSGLTMEAILRCAFACTEPNWIDNRQIYGELLDSFSNSTCIVSKTHSISLQPSTSARRMGRSSRTFVTERWFTPEELSKSVSKR